MRGALFVVLVAAMALAVVLVGRHREVVSGPQHQVARPVVDRQAPAIRPIPLTLRSAARHFVEAFLAYEAGAHIRVARVAIRAHSDHAFADQLLARSRPPKNPDAHRPALITALEIVPLPGRSDLVLATGSARRATGSEPFSFLFARRQGHWLAVAPGE